MTPFEALVEAAVGAMQPELVGLADGTTVENWLTVWEAPPLADAVAAVLRALPTVALMPAAHGADEALVALNVQARRPIQGEAMHKVIAGAVLTALADLVPT